MSPASLSLCFSHGFISHACAVRKPILQPRKSVTWQELVRGSCHFHSVGWAVLLRNCLSSGRTRRESLGVGSSFFPLAYEDIISFLAQWVQVSIPALHRFTDWDRAGCQCSQIQLKPTMVGASQLFSLIQQNHITSLTSSGDGTINNITTILPWSHLNKLVNYMWLIQTQNQNHSLPVCQLPSSAQMTLTELSNFSLKFSSQINPSHTHLHTNTHS